MDNCVAFLFRFLDEIVVPVLEFCLSALHVCDASRCIIVPISQTRSVIDATSLIGFMPLAIPSEVC